MTRWSQVTSRRISHAVLSALSVLLFARIALAQRGGPAGQEHSPTLRQALADAAKKYKIPGIAAALIENGQLRAVEVYGIRDQKSNLPVTANTIFEAGSLGEPVYAYAVLRLASEGSFNPASPLPSYLPLPYVRDLDPLSGSPATEPLYDPRFNQITALRVMSHLSGMPDWARNQHLSLRYPPGQKWLYSNEGYLYLQQVVEHVSGETFNDFVAHRVLGPAGMRRSSFVWQDAAAVDIATGYDRSGAPVEIHHYSRPAAATTLLTTIRDYAQFVQFLLASAPAQRLHESAVSLMLGPSVSVDDAVPFSWGLGLALEKSREDVYFFHRENSPGFQAFVIASRTAQRGLVIFTNSGNGLAAVPDIVAATIGGNHPILQSRFVNSQ